MNQQLILILIGNFYQYEEVKSMIILFRLNEMSRKLQLAEDEFQQSENAHQETKFVIIFK